MPFVEIFVSDHRTESELSCISNILQQELVTHFNVPEKDKFQIFHRLPSSQRHFDENYEVSENQRTQDWILIKILAGKPRTEIAREALYSALAQHLESQINLAPADLMVVIHSNDISDWSFSAGKKASLPTTKEI